MIRSCSCPGFPAPSAGRHSRDDDGDVDDGDDDDNDGNAHSDHGDSDGDNDDNDNAGFLLSPNPLTSPPAEEVSISTFQT